MLACLQDLKSWLLQTFLALNEEKTEVVLFGPSDFYDGSNLDQGFLNSNATPCAKNLGVLLDSGLRFDKQINSVVKSCFFHLRRLAKVKTFLSLRKFEIVIHVFITTCLDYCNSLYYGVNRSSIGRLQLVQNAAARLLTGSFDLFASLPS